MTGEEVRKMSSEEVSQELERLRRRLYDLKSQMVTEKLEDPTLMHKTKRDVARLLTERRARLTPAPGSKAPASSSRESRGKKVKA